MSSKLSDFWDVFENLNGDPTVDKCELLGEVEAMRDELRTQIDSMPTRATNPIPALDDCNDVDLRLV